jgi:hypothetical protein
MTSKNELFPTQRLQHTRIATKILTHFGTVKWIKTCGWLGRAGEWGGARWCFDGLDRGLIGFGLVRVLFAGGLAWPGVALWA